MINSKVVNKIAFMTLLSISRFDKIFFSKFFSVVFKWVSFF